MTNRNKRQAPGSRISLMTDVQVEVLQVPLDVCFPSEAETVSGSPSPLCRLPPAQTSGGVSIFFTPVSKAHLLFLENRLPCWHSAHHGTWDISSSPLPQGPVKVVPGGLVRRGPVSKCACPPPHPPAVTATGPSSLNVL